MSNRYKVATIFEAIDKMSAPLSRMQNRLRVFTHSADKNLRKLSRRASDVTNGLTRMAKKGLAAGAIVAAGFAASSAAGIEFEQDIVNAAAKFGDMANRGTQTFSDLEAAAQRVGATTEFSATEAAKGLDFLAMAGFDATNAIAAIPGVVDLATVAQVDLATATDIATDSLGALGLMSDDTDTLMANLARTNDVLAKTTVAANTNLVQMFEAIKDGGPAATAAGASIETTAALIGTMANAGIKGTRAGTALKNIFLAISAPGSEAAEVMRRLGVATTNADGSVRDAVAVFKDFSNAVGGLPNSQQLQVFDAIFGKIPVAAAINITNASDSLENLREQLRGADGAATKMAGKMRDTTAGSLKELRSVVEGVTIQLFALNRGPMREAIETTTAWVRANGDLIAQGIGEFFLTIANNLDTIISVGKKLAVVIAAVWALSTALKAIAAVTTVVNLLMAANPIVLGALAIAAAATAIYLAWDPIKAFFAGLWDGITGAFDRAIGRIMARIDQIKSAYGAVVGFFTGDDEDESNQQKQRRGRSRGMISQADRVAKSIEETHTTDRAEVVIKDETGKAEMTRRPRRSGALTLQSTGGF